MVLFVIIFFNNNRKLTQFNYGNGNIPFFYLFNYIIYSIIKKKLLLFFVNIILFY